jgi:hypothetical protein
MRRATARSRRRAIPANGPADAYGHSRVGPHDLRYAVARPPPETKRTITPIIGASLFTATRIRDQAASAVPSPTFAQQRAGTRPWSSAVDDDDRAGCPQRPTIRRRVTVTAAAGRS